MFVILLADRENAEKSSYNNRYEEGRNNLVKKLSLRQGLSNFFHRLREFFTIEHLRRTFVHFKDGVRIAWKIFNEKGVLSHASVCSYSMILSLVPILAISLAILNAFSPTNADITTEELLQQSEQAALANSGGSGQFNASELPGGLKSPSLNTGDTETDQAVTRNPSDAAQDAPIADDPAVKFHRAGL